MATQSALETLIELAESATDEAAKRLGRAIRSTEQAEKKLALLEQYRDEYTMRFQAKIALGVTPLGYRNFRAFIDKLDEAIVGQQQSVKEAENVVNREKISWQENERKRMSYDTLASRAKKEELRLDNRREQKLNDEHASRQGKYKQF